MTNHYVILLSAVISPVGFFSIHLLKILKNLEVGFVSLAFRRLLEVTQGCAYKLPLHMLACQTPCPSHTGAAMLEVLAGAT
jgi:hypothetical protein